MQGPGCSWDGGWDAGDNDTVAEGSGGTQLTALFEAADLGRGTFLGGVLHSLAHDPAEALASWVEPALWDG